MPGTSPAAVSVSASLIRASPKSSRRTETSGPSARRTFDGFTSRWTIPCACACASPSRIWEAVSTAIASVDVAGADRLAQRAPGHVLVGDVDVPLVAREVVGPDAPWMAQAGGRLGLALGARSRLALARDDLQGDVEPVRLVAREPDRARAAAPEHAQRPVAAEDEFGGRES